MASGTSRGPTQSILDQASSRQCWGSTRPAGPSLGRLTRPAPRCTPACSLLGWWWPPAGRAVKLGSVARRPGRLHHPTAGPGLGKPRYALYALAQRPASPQSLASPTTAGKPPPSPGWQSSGARSSMGWRRLFPAAGCFDWHLCGFELATSLRGVPLDLHGDADIGGPALATNGTQARRCPSFRFGLTVPADTSLTRHAAAGLRP